MSLSRRVLAVLTAAGGLLLCLLSSSGLSQEVISREYETKAGVISVLGKFVTWPEDVAPSRERPLTIGVLGNDAFFEAGVNQLDRTVADERLKGRNLVIRRFDSAKDYQPCHILFVSDKPTEKSVEKTLAERLAAARKLAEKRPLLLVADSPGLASQGVTANMIFDRSTNLIRLEINPDAANRAGLKLAPQLLRLSLVQIVRDSK